LSDSNARDSLNVGETASEDDFAVLSYREGFNYAVGDCADLEGFIQVAVFENSGYESG
jgi:hypothetical protein